MVESNDQVFLCMEPIAKGKRTKRQRTPSLLALSMACSSSSTVLDDNTTSGDHAPATTAPSPPSSDHRSSAQEEEEDMANCLMLLAQGHNTTKQSSSSSEAPRGKLVGESYQCKTCDRCFPSFQALGGHRASHRKPKAAIINTGDDKKATVNSSGGEEGGRVDQIVNPNTTLSLRMPIRVLHGGGKSKLHECAICGAEFTSGQALGGHMRRHRTIISAPPITTVTTTSINFERHEPAKKPKNGLHLDLNLPAPEDRESCLSAPPKQQVIVFSASSLIDCYY